MEDSALVHLVQPSQVRHSGTGLPHRAEEHGPQTSCQTGQGRGDLIFVIFLHKCIFLGSIFLHMKARKLWQNLPKFLKISQISPKFLHMTICSPQI